MLMKGIGATTHVDRHNMKIAKEALDSMADQVNNSGSVPSVGLNHDRTIMPFGKVIAAEVSMMEDGEFKIELTREIFEKTRALTLDNGETFIEVRSDNDFRPFAEHKYDTNKLSLSYDPMNFESKHELDNFLSDILNDYDINTEMVARKQLIPDPELVFTISTSVVSILVGKKVVDKVIDKLLDNAIDEMDNFYKFVRSTILKYIKYAIPKNRPITYVFQLAEEANIELVAITNDIELLMKSIEEEKIKLILNRIEDVKKKFEINRVQFLLNKNGEWEFNYLLTKEGAVIGSQKCYSRSIKAMEFYKKG